MDASYYQTQIETEVTADGRPVRLAIHTADHEHAPLDRARLEAPYLSGAQKRTYTHARPVISEPRYSATVAWDAARGSGEIISAEQAGEDPHYIGNAQAWHYLKDELLVLWECYLYEPYRSGPPEEDETHLEVWTAFEDWLMDRFDPRLILSPAWEPVYETGQWQQFLRARGYDIRARAAVRELK
jgi:hypothetical protein